MLMTRHQPSTGLVWANVHASGEPQRIIADTSADPSTWDAPLTSDANRDSYFDPRYPGDVTNSSKSGVNSITVGGRWDNTSFAGVAFACAGYDISEANEYRGARLAYLLSERDGGSGTCLSHRTDSPPLKPEVGSFDPSVSQNNCPMSRD